MRATTLIGILIGTAAIFGAYAWEGGAFDTLFLPAPMLIVFGGTLAAGLAGTSFSITGRIPGILRTAFFPEKYDLLEIINQIVMYSKKSRRDGLLSLEKELDKARHPYLKKMFEICIDGADAETFNSIMQVETDHITKRHNENIALFTKMGGYSPTMGIIGTVMGLISTLASAGSDPNILIHHIASAFIATMWGIFMANLVWLPIADKLKHLHAREMSIMNVMMDGVTGVMLGETPTVIQARLLSAFPLGEQKKIRREGGKSGRPSGVNPGPAQETAAMQPAQPTQPAPEKQAGEAVAQPTK